jgi:hypothetical protein
MAFSDKQFSTENTIKLQTEIEYTVNLVKSLLESNDSIETYDIDEDDGMIFVDVTMKMKDSAESDEDEDDEYHFWWDGYDLAERDYKDIKMWKDDLALKVAGQLDTLHSFPMNHNGDEEIEELLSSLKYTSKTFGPMKRSNGPKTSYERSFCDL